ncbi:MAG: hypothetical protein R2706_16445 [Acidimicrobiales bacterium]
MLERDDFGAGELHPKVPHVRDGGRAESVDGLSVVANGAQVGVWPTHALDNARLDWIGVLVFVDQDVVEQATECVAGGANGEATPKQQQVVEVEDLLFAFASGVGRENYFEIVEVFGAPRVVGVEHLTQLGLAVDHSRVDGGNGFFAGESFAPFAKSFFVSHDAEKIGCVALVEDREVFFEPCCLAIVAKNPV